jgi:1-acyl-sn-glycerol-3-phosphate acyltransferase
MPTSVPAQDTREAGPSVGAWSAPDPDRGRAAVASQQQRAGHREPLYAVVIAVLAAAVRVAFRLRVLGRLPERGPAVLAPNHLSYWDPVVLGVAAQRRGRRLRFFAQEPLFSKPVVGWILRTTRQIPVRRGLGPERATDAVRAALDAGEVVVIYPEGTIPRAGECPPPKRGIGLVAARCRVPVIPVAMWGVQPGRGVRRFLPRQPAAVLFGTPLDLERYAGASRPEDHLAASEQVLDAVRALLPQAQRAAGRRALSARSRRR